MTPKKPPASMLATQVATIPLRDIEPNVFRDAARYPMTEHVIERLVASIAAHRKNARCPARQAHRAPEAAPRGGGPASAHA
jgi:hypothetical protein